MSSKTLYILKSNADGFIRNSQEMALVDELVRSGIKRLQVYSIIGEESNLLTRYCEKNEVFFRNVGDISDFLKTAELSNMENHALVTRDKLEEITRKIYQTAKEIKLETREKY